jgi:hypothetical protein
MESFGYFFIIVYFIYVIFSDNIFAKLIFNEDIKFPPDIIEIAKRSLFISYISLLLVAAFFFNKNKFTWNLAFMVSLFSLLVFIICNFLNGKELKIPPNGNYSLTGIIMHSLVIVPLLLYPEYFNFSIDIKLVLGLACYLLFAHVTELYVY